MKLRSPIAWAALLGTAALALASGASAQDRAVVVQNPTSQGRYAIFYSPHARADMYLLDTQTGQIWKPTTFTDVSGPTGQPPELWMPQERIDTREEFSAWLKRHVE